MPSNCTILWLQCCVSSPHNHAKFNSVSGGLPECIIWLYNGWFQGEGSKAFGRGKSARAMSRGNQEQYFKGPIPVGSPRTHNPPPPATNCDNTGEVPLFGKLIRDSVLRVFIGGSSYRHLLPNKYPNARASEGQQVSSTNHVICVHSVGTWRLS